MGMGCSTANRAKKKLTYDAAGFPATHFSFYLLVKGV
jgi:hypothetical protein